jgi:hypothetical protein
VEVSSDIRATDFARQFGLTELFVEHFLQATMKRA